MRLLLATAATLPRADTESLYLRNSLAVRGVAATMHPWEDSSVDWQAHPVLIRSTWNYTDRLAAFEIWLERASRRGVWNPISLLRWNIHKSYLLGLARAGCALPSTRLLRQGEMPTLDGVPVGDDGRLVVKPAVGAGARHAMRASPDEPRLLRHLATMLRERDMLVQPYLPEIEAGERSLIFFNGRFSHAVEKRPAEGDWRVQTQHGGINAACVPKAAEMVLAEVALAAVPGLPLYARVDLAPGPLLMELELIEPELFLQHDPYAVEAFADAVVDRL